MGKVKTTWLLPGHSGRACNHEDIYTKQNKKTNQVYSVKICNPVEDWSAKQKTQRNNFGNISAAISAWVKENRENDTEAYKAALTMYNRQSKYATLRGMMFAKGMAELENDGSVVISVGGYSTTYKVSDGEPSDGDGTNPSGGGGGSANPPSGDSDSNPSGGSDDDQNEL